MKTLILMLAVALTASANAQKLSEQNVPQAVRSAFQKLYSSASSVKWEQEKDNFEAEFKVKDIKQSVLFDPQGSVLETETEINQNDLPAAIRQYLLQHHKGQKVEEVAKITDAKGTISYEVEIKGKDLLFDAQGNLITTNK